MSQLIQKVEKWNNDTTISFDKGIDYQVLYEYILYLAEKKFDEYHPTIGPFAKFEIRLGDWLDNLNDESEQRALLRLVPYMFFVDSADFISLYQSAFNGQISRWLIDEANISYEDAVFTNKIRESAAETWFCPITDSMDIAAFCHINRLSGANCRPDWHSLFYLGDPAKVSNWMKTGQTLKRIVLLEDFVGSGDQMSRAIDFAVKLPSSPSVLVVPLIVGIQGRDYGYQMQAAYSQLTFSPVIALNESAFIYEKKIASEPELFATIRRLAKKVHPQVCNEAIPDISVKPYGPFGFGSNPTMGGLTLMYTNCPDNTMPLIHHRSGTWNPLFPRSSRL